jgi:hypothetical protein
MKRIVALIGAGLLLVPFVSFAQMYHYVALDGTIKDVDASNPQEALMMGSRDGDALHSGVKMDANVLQPGENVGNLYTYMATSGSLKTITAAGFDAALMLATDRVPTSGFLVNGK